MHKLFMKPRPFAINQGGYITLLAVLILGAVGVSITISILLLSTDASRTAFTLEQSKQSRALANTCAEEALQRVRRVTAYTGTANITLGKGSCSYSITNTGGENRTINASSSVDTVVRKEQIFLNQINPSINITSWQEIADF
jgi:hypothetical protein